MIAFRKCLNFRLIGSCSLIFGLRLLGPEKILFTPQNLKPVVLYSYKNTLRKVPKNMAETELRQRVTEDQVPPPPRKVNASNNLHKSTKIFKFVWKFVVFG